MKSARIVPSLRAAWRPTAAPLRAVVAGPSTLPVRSASTSAPEIPSNVAFEDLAGSSKRVRATQIERGECLHSESAGEITHPLSSLASPRPTAATDATVLLPSHVFSKPLRKDILHRNVVWYLSTLRQGNQSTKSRSSINYSGRKLRPQKGSGKARVGDRSSGTRRGGAPIHPLEPKDWAQDLPRKVRELGLQTALSAKLASGLFRVVSDLNEANWLGTNDCVRALADGVAGDEFVHRFGPKDSLSVLFLFDPAQPQEDVERFWRVIRNVPGLDLLPTDEVLAYDVLKYTWVVADAAAVQSMDRAEWTFDPDMDADVRSELTMQGIGGVEGEQLARMVQQVDLGRA